MRCNRMSCASLDATTLPLTWKFLWPSSQSKTRGTFHQHSFAERFTGNIPSFRRPVTESAAGRTRGRWRKSAGGARVLAVSIITGSDSTVRAGSTDRLMATHFHARLAANRSLLVRQARPRGKDGASAQDARGSERTRKRQGIRIRRDMAVSFAPGGAR